MPCAAPPTRSDACATRTTGSGAIWRGWPPSASRCWRRSTPSCTTSAGSNYDGAGRLMGEPRRVELTLLGQALTVRTEAPPEYVRTLARYLEKRGETPRESRGQEPHQTLPPPALATTHQHFPARAGP